MRKFFIFLYTDVLSILLNYFPPIRSIFTANSVKPPETGNSPDQRQNAQLNVPQCHKCKNIRLAAFNVISLPKMRLTVKTNQEAKSCNFYADQVKSHQLLHLIINRFALDNCQSKIFSKQNCVRFQVNSATREDGPYGVGPQNIAPQRGRALKFPKSAPKYSQSRPLIPLKVGP